jgi:hypothetical protein
LQRIGRGPESGQLALPYKLGGPPVNAKAEAEGKPYACTRATASLGAWDFIGVGSTDVGLVQVKTRDWPGAVEIETLQLSQLPEARPPLAGSAARARCERRSMKPGHNRWRGACGFYEPGCGGPRKAAWGWAQARL